MKRFFIFMLVKLRLLALWRHFNRRKITILMLHGVAGEWIEASWSPLWKRPTRNQVAKVIGELSEYYTPISMRDAVQILDGSAPPVDHGLVVTFDDGYRNNFTEALPALHTIGVPAMFFVASGYVETRRSYWVDRLDYALQHAPNEQRLLRSSGYEFDLRGLEQEKFSAAYRNLRVSLKRNEPDDKHMLSVVEEFCRGLEMGLKSTIDDVIETDPYASIATWAECRAALEQGVTIGSHSVDHFRLTSIPKSDVDEQLVESKRQIEEKIGAGCDVFCYPNGSYDDYVLERTKAAGYRAAVTTSQGLNKVGDNLFALKRYALPHSENINMKLLRLSGVLELPIVKVILSWK